MAPLRRLTTGGAVAALLVAGLSPLTLAAAPAAAAPPACADTQPDAAKAATMARDCRKRVEILPLRTGTAQTFARPEGGYTTEGSVAPRWSHRPDGSWSPIDTTLVATGGTVAPKASALPVTFSGGGTGPLATLRDGDRELAVSWPGGALPAPTLSGDSATYPEVLPGVDLTVTATALGFSEVLVVKNRQAAADPALREVTFGLATKGVTTRAAEGGLVAVDDKGAPVFTSPTPVMWDSADKATPAAKGLKAPAQSTREPKKATMPVRAGNGTLTVTPDKAMVDAADTVYPLFIDPSWGGGLRNNNWANVFSKFPDSTGLTLTGDGKVWGNAGSGKVCDFDNNGNCLSSTYQVRSLFQMDTGPIRGHHVTKASFHITQRHAWTCAPKSNAKLWRTENVANPENYSTTTWRATNDKDKFRWHESTTAPGNHRADSNYGCDGAGNVEFDVTGWTRAVADSGAWYLGVGLRAENEGDVNQWKRFDAGSARLAVDYNDPPTLPDWLQVDGRNCATGEDRPVVPTRTPTLSARPWDPDGDTQQVWLAAVKWTGTAYDESTGVAGYQDSVANGTRGHWTTPALVENGIYGFRAQTNDYGKGGVGPVTNTNDCQFQVDTVAPTMPKVTSAEYPESCSLCGGIGRNGSFTFKSSPDVRYFKWGFGTSLTREAPAAHKGDPVTVSWTPGEGSLLQQTLNVQAVDHAGLLSPVRKYQFTLNPGQPAKAQWLLDDAAGTKSLTNAQNPGVLDATLNAGTLGTPGRVRDGDTALTLNGTAAHYASAPAVVDTSRSFSVAAWVRVDDTTGFRTFVSQCGTARCAYYLQYMANTDRWAFAMPSEDKANPAGYSIAQSAQAPRKGIWTHLTGVYDASAAKVRLYVNGQLDGEQGSHPGWKATGPTYLGKAMNADLVKGGLADVRIWDRVISPNEAAVAADPLLTGTVGEWRFEEKSGDLAFDSTNYSRHLRLTATQGATWGPGHSSNGGLHLDGTGHAAADGPVLNTDQSFSVSAWVRLQAMPTWNSVVLSQEGTKNSAFALRYANQGGGKGSWAFTCLTTDDSATSFSDALGQAPLTSADLNRWQHLVGVYDASRAELRLYVDDVLQNTAPCRVWNAGGRFTVGRGKWNGADADRWTGDIDEVKVLAGVVVPAKVIAVEGPRTGNLTWNGTTNCAGVPNGNTTDPRGVITWGCITADDSQAFTYDPETRTLRALGKCLDVRQGVAQNGTAIQMAACNDSAAQTWTFDPATQAFSALGLCLDVPGGKSDWNLTLQLYTCNGSPAQRWHLG
ncbi:LamG-like jellyroll fold domain-containing protein [Longispora sp. NPDC051575]|uniref:LamG-like jellyroll fold domain-containing protein n=1 Tax=Longispora sp. NPDC051575 TaxID=3154943 RepID=UPI00343C44DF